MPLIPPRTLQGFSDYLPSEMPRRQYLINTWREIFETYGYGQLETPALEYADILLGKYGEEEKLIYHFKDHGDRHIALRYDQTVPLARAVAQHYNQLHFPFKRYEINRVWRAEAARKGRKREFYQCDIDILGSSSLICEAEIMAVMQAGFKKLRLPKAIIHLNHRQILNGFIKSLNIPENKAIEVTRSIDKLDKVGINGVEDELKSRELPAEAIPKIIEFISIEEKNPAKLIKKLTDFLPGNDLAAQGLKELKELIEHLKLMGLKENDYKISLNLVRGLDYYTGIVFEALVPDSGYGSIGGGGRYDNLCGLFSPHQISGVGVGIGFERIYAILEEQDLFPDDLVSTQILVTVFNEETRSKSLEVAKNLREAGFKTMVYLDNDKLGKQFQYADKSGIPLAIVIGPDEIKKGTVVVKNMKTGEQVDCHLDKLVQKISENQTANQK